MNAEINPILLTIFEEHRLILAVLSDPLFSKKKDKLTIRPVLIKGKGVYQVTTQHGQQALHQNYSSEEMIAFLKQKLSEFKQSFFYTSTADYHLLANKKGKITLLKKPPSKSSLSLDHNRSKQYLLEEGESIPFLVHLGVMSPDGKVHAQKRDKFRQINRFLEMVEDLLPHLGNPSSSLHLIDFGCGKAYLTFALFHFLKILKGYPIKMIGIDLKEEVIAYCQQISNQLGYGKELQFIVGDINAYDTKEPVDLVVSLHACDIATDAALEKAVRWQARAILSVPCCQHELFKQVKQEKLAPILTHGILKERFAALATDAARVQLLEALGYQTQILEFIEVEHTPKNLLIRAIRRPQLEHQRKAWKSYLIYKEALHIDPSLERRFREELKALEEC